MKMGNKKLYGFVMLDESGKQIKAFGRCYKTNLDKMIRYAFNNEWIFVINSLYYSTKMKEYFAKPESK